MTSEDDVKNVTKDNLARASQAGLDTKNKVSEALDATPEVAGGLYDQARAKTRDMTEGLPDAAGDALAAGHQSIMRGGDQVARHVAKQPVEALMLAGAIGFLIGWAVNRA